MRLPPASVGLLVSMTVLGLASRARAQNADTPPSSSGSPGDLSAGGLKPPSSDTAPPSASEPDAPSETQKKLEESDEKDSGRGLEFVYFDVETGLQQVGLNTLHTSNPLVPTTVSTSDSGPMVGVGAGLRLLFLTVGPRFRIGHFADWDLWSLDLEGGLHIPLGSVEPYFTLGAGYSKLGQVSQAQVGSDSGASIKGYNVRGGIGLDYYVTNVFSIGANLTGEVLALTRPKVSIADLGTQPNVADCKDLMAPPDQIEACVTQKAKAKALTLDGSSIGISTTFSLVLGLHF